MKTRIAILVSMILAITVSSGCVSNERFDEFVKQVNLQHDVLACEAKVDAYEERTGSDEPDPTRRDEPLPTRHDEPGGTRRDLESCEEEFGRVVGGTAPGDNYAQCQPKLVTCVDLGNNTFPECNACFDRCMDPGDLNGTWPDLDCDLTP